MTSFRLVFHVHGNEPFNQFFWVHLGAPGPIDPNTIHPNLPFDSLVVMTVITSACHVLKFPKIVHPSRVLPISLAIKGILQTKHALVHFQRENPGKIPNTFNTWFFPASSPPRMFKSKQSTLTVLQLTNLHCEVQQHSPLDQFSFLISRILLMPAACLQRGERSTRWAYQHTVGLIL